MIQMCSVAAAAMIGSGAVTFKNGLIMVAGTGDVINIGLTITLAILLIKLIGNKLGSYTTILLPIIVLVVGGGIGLLILPYVKTVTTFIGMIVMAFTKLQPLLMGVLIGMSFAAMIVSPISSVGDRGGDRLDRGCLRGRQPGHHWGGLHFGDYELQRQRDGDHLGPLHRDAKDPDGKYAGEAEAFCPGPAFVCFVRSSGRHRQPAGDA